MVIVKTVKPGNILEATEQYIAQQCNCLTVRPHGLSKAIAEAYPHGNYYATRRPAGHRNLAVEDDRDTPGTLKIIRGEPNIINIFGQWAPGSVHSRWISAYPSFREGRSETKADRLQWFKEAITTLDKMNLDLVAVPEKIGCGLAGGDWSLYKEVLQSAKTKFVIYGLVAS